jgi:spore maturation protein CgeB
MKIILFSSGFNSYDISIKKVLKNRGHDVNHLSYRSDLFSGSFWKRLLYKFKNKINNNYESDFWNFKLIELNNKHKPDLIFILKGDIIYEQTFKLLKQNNTKIICWFMDVISLYPHIKNNLKFYDHFFTFEPDDILDLRKFNKNVHYLPLAFDSEVFFYKKSIKKWDFTFVGSYSKNRENFLLDLSNRLLKEDLKIAFFFNYYSFSKPSTWQKYFNKNKSYRYFQTHKYFSLDEINNIFNQSKICLNIHQSFTNNALNIRTYEIYGSGQIQMIENFISLKNSNFKKGSILKYKNMDELVDNIKYTLKNYEQKKYSDNKNQFHERIDRIFSLLS